MYRLIEFLRSIYLFLLFIVLEGSAIYIYATSDSYARAKMLNYTSSVVGVVDGAAHTVVDYFSLRSENRALLERVAYLEGRLMGSVESKSDSLLMAMSYYDEELGATFQAAKVVSNTINRRLNYLVVNRGLQSGVRAGMAVVTPQREIVGVVMECSDNFSVVMSVLNTKFRTSGVIEGDSHAGGISWSGENRYRVQMHDLSRYAKVDSGAMVVTTAFSQIFPPGVKIGRIVDFDFDRQNMSYNLDVDLVTDISGVDRVLIINYNLTAEGAMLLERVVEEDAMSGEYSWE